MIVWKHKWLSGAVALLLVVGCLVYWINGFSEKKALEVTVIIKTTDDSVEFWQVLIDGVHEAAKEFDANVQVWGSKTETDVDEQISLVEKAMRNRPDAIVLAANDFDRLVPISEKARKSGIKLIIVDSGINSDAAKSIVATDNVKAGREAGQAMHQELTGNAKVAIISYVKNAASHIDREKGVREVLGQYPNIELLDTYYVEGSEQNAYLKAKEILRKHTDVLGIIGLNEPTTVGAGRAIQELELKERVKLIGFDSSVNEIKLLEEGVMKATVIQRPFQMGYLSIKTAMEAVKGKKVSKFLDTGSLVITKQNMYDEENQKLLFPFVGK
ncbi:substrate-binding domain-containing protein [Cohnella lupini]|uniref:Monosaccharide ABC transporter substrate-binding protein (CUT2 family) n=1 Tax=Cohnella lupini TaxID=1294267 RepID=A0A3D9ISQ5_9BACL|nr:substrate-binding domain-containing protein [Cohnella lupini]RED64800.1 monosaccharide ABC transporter substrate-binding protein (CUT2 family) [Cohnella lupini]